MRKKGITKDRRSPSRLTALDRLEIAGLSDNDMLERATRLAARWIGTPVAVISLVEKGELHPVCSVGVPLQQTSNVLLCKQALNHRGDILEIEDLQLDARFRNLPCVTAEMGMRFYAGICLRDPNLVPVGVLCIADVRPRRLTADEKQAMTDLSVMVQFGLMLRGLARTDPLTRTYNRRHLELEIDREWRRALRHRIPVSALMIDIDRFKDFNDTFGHQHGDQALKAVAVAINSCFRRGYDLLVRYGGEEFLALLPETPPEVAMDLAEKVRAAVEALQISHPMAHGPVLTVSVGCATLDGEARSSASSEQLIDEADQAVYQAKRKGRNRVAQYRAKPASRRTVARRDKSTGAPAAR